MSLIKSRKTYPSLTHDAKLAFVLCGFGGSIWQTRRLIRTLQRKGYSVTAFDFPKDMLSKGDPSLLPQLIDEVVDAAEAEATLAQQPILLVGVSLGALIALNIVRRSSLFNEAVLITGGDIAKVAQRIYGTKVWPQSYEALAHQWRDINMYSAPARLKNKRLLFVLPAKDNLIDTSDVYTEVALQNKAGNYLLLIERPSFGHIGTIIEETILFPQRVHGYIEKIMKTGPSSSRAAILKSWAEHTKSNLN
jgi:pimeloyl-ACP methyl ester carboxylesterase